MTEFKNILQLNIKSIMVLAAFIIFDIMSGIIKAIIKGELKSSKAREGLMKKFLEIILVIMGFALDYMLTLDYIGKGVLYFLIALEGFSILENIDDSGIAIPQVLKDILEKIRNGEVKEMDIPAKLPPVVEKIEVPVQVEIPTVIEIPEVEVKQFVPRKTAPTEKDGYNTKQTYWGQCTAYCYERAKEAFGAAPCYWNRKTKTGSFTNANMWIENYREPWVPKPADYKPVPGDIIVWAGTPSISTAGHVAFVEEDLGDGKYMISQYNKIKYKFSYDEWTLGAKLNGPVKGYLHYEGE